MLDKLFIFPIVMVDGDNEQQKEEMGDLIGNKPEIDIIIGEAECPYYDFVSISDRWLPKDSSLDQALTGKFDACYVNFGQSGNYMIPWTKTKFKREFQKFLDKMPKDDINVVVLKSEK